MSQPIIKPTVGRVVWFYPSLLTGEAGFAPPKGDAPLAAIIAHVWSDTMVNLAVFDANGASYPRTSVRLVHEELTGDRPAEAFCTWMPFQKGQAAKQNAAAAAPLIGLPVRDQQPVPASSGAPIQFDFGDAIRHLKEGRRVARAGWNGKGMWLALSCDGTREVPAANFWAPANREWAEHQPNGTAMVLPSVTMKTATGEILMGWLASQTDMLAEDWVVVE